MIGRVYPLGKGFKGLISYLETGRDGRQKQRDRVEWVEFRNLPTRNPRTAAYMMAATASESATGTTTPVYHFSISCDPDDPVGPDTLRRVADRTVRDLGLEEYEVLIFAHKDRSHPHLHFVVNRVHPERYTLWRPWRDYFHIERSLRAQEVELGLKVVPGWLAPIPTQAIDGPGHGGAEKRPRPQPGIRRGDAAFIASVIERAVPVLERSESWAELQRGLAEHGLAVRVKGGGITLTDGRQEAKASEVGREFSRRNLEKRFGSYPDYRARMAVADEIARTRSPVQPPADAQEPTAQPLPSAPGDPPAPEPDRRVLGRQQPPFSDAGHGITELFGTPEPSVAEQPTPVVERCPPPKPLLSRGPGFLREVKKRATPVFKQAQSWAELESGLAEHGLFLRVKGGGFVVTDGGEQEVKASEVGRPFSRFYLEKRFGRYPGLGGSAAQLNVLTPAAPEPVAPTEPTLPTPAPSEPVRPPESRESGASTDQLMLPLSEPLVEGSPSEPLVENPPPAAGAAGSEQLHLPLTEPGRAEPARGKGKSSVPTRLSSSSADRPGAEQSNVPPTLHVPTSPLTREAPPGPPLRHVEEPVGTPSREMEPATPRPDVSLPPELQRAAELMREALASNKAERNVSTTESAAEEATKELKRLKELNDTAAADVERLREALHRVYTDHRKAAGELNRCLEAHGRETMSGMLYRAPDEFGRLRYPRLWYTRGPGRKDLDNIIAQLEKALRSARGRPTQEQLEAADVHARATATDHSAARLAKRRIRNAALCENEAAGALRPLLRHASPEWIAHQLTSLLPPEDREAAQMAEHVLKVALVTTRGLTRGPSRGGIEL